jgi:tetratricopeptide (TPR) repeat protein
MFMERKQKYSIRMLGLLILLIAHTSILSAQVSLLEVIGTVEANLQPISNARVILYKDGIKTQSLFSDSNGEFRFEMDINSEYLIEVEKAGLLGKKIAFNTIVPNEITGRWTMEFAMSLFPSCEGVNATALNEPVDRIKFSTNKVDFISDEAYVSKMKGRIEQLLADIDQCQADKYKAAIDEGDRLTNEKKFDEARTSYEKALDIYPGDKIVQRKITELDKISGLSLQNERVYKNATAEADRLYAAKDYEGAKAKYTEAMKALPQNGYPQTKIDEINTIVQQQQQERQVKLDTDKKYNDLIAKANAAYTSKNYEIATDFYQQAIEVKPDAAFPRQKIVDIGPLMAQQKKEMSEKEANDKAYTEAIAMGQNALQNNDFNAAKQHFNRALLMRPEESLPRQKISEVDKKVQEKQMAEAQADKAAMQQKVTKSLDDGDAYLTQKNLDAAEEAYRLAIQLDPNDLYAKQQLNKVKSMQLAANAQKQQAMEKVYTESVDKGDELVAAASYQQAIEAFKQALLQKPDDLVVKNKLAAAEQQLASEQQNQSNEQIKRKQYDDLLLQANNAFTAKQYTQAKQSYQSALTLYPEQSLPRNRLQEIDKILADQQKEQQYKDLITKADGLFAAKAFDQAKSAYQQAIALNAADMYAKQKVDEIDGIFRENERKASEQKARDAQYITTIQEADKLLAQSQLTEAKLAYQRALGMKPGETYPQQQIAKINGLIAEQIRKENEKKSIDDQYANLVSKADGFMTQKDYGQAKTLYEQALALKTTEDYPKQRISVINGIILDQAKGAADQKARDDQFKKAIQDADNLYAAANLEEAKLVYQRALSIKPAETYPAAQIAKIDAQLTERLRQENDQKAKEMQYNNAISRSDQLYTQDKLTEAKLGYQGALQLKPGETYPTGQIAKIDGQLALREKEKQQKATYEQKYTTLIAEGDKAYDKRDYPVAKSAYMQALNLKPAEKYPQDRLNKIAEFERVLAQQEKNRKTAATDDANASATNSPAPTKLAVLNFANDSERDKYLNGLRNKYPVGVTLEVYKEKNLTTYRYVVIRGTEVREFRKVQFSWGGVDFSDNGIPTTGQYFDSQIKARSGEFYQEFNY